VSYDEAKDTNLFIIFRNYLANIGCLQQRWKTMVYDCVWWVLVHTIMELCQKYIMEVQIKGII